MTPSISFQSNLDGWTRHLSQNVARQVPFATAKALTDTVKRDMKPAAERLVGRKFDRPTPFTRRGFAVMTARKEMLVASVFAKDIQGRYLRVQEEGGVRRPAKRAIVVPVGIRRNKYGNMTRNAVRNALAKPDTFSGTVAGVPGIWKRLKGGKLKLLVRYEDRASYEPRFGFHAEIRKVASAAFPARFARSLEHAIRTAR